MNEVNNFKFVTRKWNIVNDSSKANYNAAYEIIYNTEFLKFNLCDYNNAYILAKRDITVTAAPQTQAAFKNCAQFPKGITKVDETTTDADEDLNLVM